MRQQRRPFIVGIKKKRGGFRRNSSIWGELNLSRIAAEVLPEAEDLDTQNRKWDISDVPPIDVGHCKHSRKEHRMADPKEDESLQISNEAPLTAEAPDMSTKDSQQKAPRAKSKRSTRKAATLTASSAARSTSIARSPRRTYSQAERAQKLNQIEKAIATGDTSKTAVKKAGISEQTYYHWKRAVAAPVSDVGDLKDLLALEEENKRLKRLLADRLRKENAELKRKLGVD